MSNITNIIIEKVKIFVKLIIIEKKLNFIEKIFFDIIKKDKDIILDPFNNNLNYLDNKKIKTTNFTDNLAKIIGENKAFIKKKIINELDNFSELSQMKISEINFSDKYWKVFFFRKYLKKIVLKKKISKVFLISSSDFMLHKALKLIFKKNLFTHIRFLKYFYYIINYLKILIIFFNNFFIELINSIIIRKNNFQFPSKNLLIANFPRDWDLLTLNYKFLGKHTKKFSVIVSNSRTNSNFLKYFHFSKIPKNFFILESFLEFFDVLKIYFNSVLSIFDNYKNIKSSCENLGLEFYSYEILITYNLIERSKNNTLKLAISKFLNDNKKYNKSFIPMFEFVESRVYSKILADKKIKTFSFQHSAVMTVHQTRFFTANNALKIKKPNFLPDNILVEGKISSSNLKSIKINNQIVGAVRLKNYKDYKIPKFANKSNRNILYIDELYDKQNLFSLLNFINNEKGKFNFFIRLHPANFKKLSKIILNFEKKNKNIYLDKSKTIEEAIYKNKIGFCIASSCTSFLDLIKKKQPCFLLKKKNLFLNTPYNFKYKQLYINNFNDIEKKILLSKNKYMPSENYIKNYISYMGYEAEIKIGKLLKY
jgi:hypothetical protein